MYSRCLSHIESDSTVASIILEWDSIASRRRRQGIISALAYSSALSVPLRDANHTPRPSRRDNSPPFTIGQVAGIPRDPKHPSLILSETLFPRLVGWTAHNRVICPRIYFLSCEMGEGCRERSLGGPITIGYYWTERDLVEKLVPRVEPFNPIRDHTFGGHPPDIFP
jgi:hypothetical protein